MYAKYCLLCESALSKNQSLVRVFIFPNTFIAHSMPVVIAAWVSVVQSRQLGTYKHLTPMKPYILHYSEACVKADTISFLNYPVTLPLLPLSNYMDNIEDLNTVEPL